MGTEIKSLKCEGGIGTKNMFPTSLIYVRSKADEETA